jgi:hypothetical protein
MRSLLNVCFVSLITFSGASAFAQGEWVSPAPNPCAGRSCPGNFTCVVVQGEPTCSCPAGYTADAAGTNCVSAPQRVIVDTLDVSLRMRHLNGRRLTVAGIVLEASFAPFFITGLFFAGLAWTLEESITGLVLVSVGGAGTITGMVMTLVGYSRMKAARRQEVFGSAQRPTILPSLAFTHDRGAVFGLNGAF